MEEPNAYTRIQVEIQYSCGAKEIYMTQTNSDGLNTEDFVDLVRAVMIASGYSESLVASALNEDMCDDCPLKENEAKSDAPEEK